MSFLAPSKPKRRVVVRVSDEELQRLHRLCRKRKLPLQVFGHAAILRALDEADLGKKVNVQVINEQPDVQATVIESKGLGIREQIRSENEPREEERPVKQPPTPWLPPPAPTHRIIDDVVLALARTIVGSAPEYRRDVWKNACRTLASGKSQEEALRLAEDLDAAIQRISGVPQTALERVRTRMG